MSAFVLKLLAVISMFIDHLTDVLHLSGTLPFGRLYILGRAIGRPAFVIYCFMLVNGFDKTRDRKKYLSRLILFAVISQIPYTLAFTKANYYPVLTDSVSYALLGTLPLLLPLAAYFVCVCRCRRDASLIWVTAALALKGASLILYGTMALDSEHMNVFYTLAVGMAAMMTAEHLLHGKWDRKTSGEWLKVLLMLASVAALLYSLQPSSDYGLLGAALIFALYLARKSRWAQLAVAATWCLIEYRWCVFDYPSYRPLLVGALLALVPIALYNGRLGPKMRSFFYIFYPAHLTLLWAAMKLLPAIGGLVR